MDAVTGGGAGSVLPPLPLAPMKPLGSPAASELPGSEKSQTEPQRVSTVRRIDIRFALAPSDVGISFFSQRTLDRLTDVYSRLE